MATVPTPLPPFTTHTPGCILVLVDQSGSMADPFTDPAGKGVSKARGVASGVNRMIEQLVLLNTKGATVLDRCHLAVLGYGRGATHRLAGWPSVLPLSQVAASPLRHAVSSVETYDGIGGFVTVETHQPVWVEPVAYGGTPMCAALREAGTLLEAWVQQHPDSCPPIVLHLTDGVPTDGDPAEAFAALAGIGTRHGGTLVFNLLLGEPGAAPRAWLRAEDLPEGDPLTPLVRGASVLPEGMRHRAEALYGRPLPPEARAAVLNGDSRDVVRLFDIGSVAAHA